MTHARLTAAIALLLIVSAAGILAQDPEDVVTVDSSLVVLNAAVFDPAGNAVSGLTQKQFRVLEDGIEQPLEFFEAESTPFAAVILLDTSGSMEQRVSLARSAAITFLQGLRPEDSAAIIKFDSKVETIQDFSNSRDIVERIFDVKAYGMTVLNDAIQTAAAELSKRPEKRRAIIVLSDGMDTKSKRSSDSALKAALAANATIYTIDMASMDTGGRERMQNQAVLKNFAEKSGGLFIATPGGVAMREAFRRIVEELGVQYTLGYQPANTKRDGKWRAIEIRVARPNLTIRTRKGYNAPRGN